MEVEEGNFNHCDPSECGLSSRSHGLTDEQGELCCGFSPGGRSLRSRDGNFLSEREFLEDPFIRSPNSHIGVSSDRFCEAVNFC